MPMPKGHKVKHAVHRRATTMEYTASSLWKRVLKTETCWLWTGAITSRGYGRLTNNGKKIATHRLAYMLLRGPIPDGHVIDHLCHNRLCCNPSHLDPVTQAVNVRRGHRATSLYCHKGHLYEEKGVYITSTGARSCRACCQERYAKLRAAKKGKKS